MRGCVIGGVIASLAAIIGYFRIFPSLNDLLLLYDRARGTFKDPNVLGAFLIFPTLLALQRVLAGTSPPGGARARCCSACSCAAILLSFSRAAWGQFVYTALLMLALTFVTTRSPSQRLRIVLLSVTGVVVHGGCSSRRCCRSTSSPTCSSSAPASSRATTSARRAASARYVLGADPRARQAVRHRAAAIQQVSSPRTPHNSFLNAFMSGGWLAGACYPTLVALTLVFGFRAVFVAHALAADLPSRSIAAYFGVVGRKRHHRHRPLAPHVPAARRDVGPDRGDAPLRRARSGAGRADACCSRPAARLLHARRRVVHVAASERSAARLAHQSGGLGVASSNLAAPTR